MEETMVIVKDKLSSLLYKVKAKRFKTSRVWKNNPHNRTIPAFNRMSFLNELERVTKTLCLPIESYEINENKILSFIKKYEIPSRSLYALRNRGKKILEHFIAVELLNLKNGETYIDVASENSPFPQLFRKNIGVKAYSLDINYKKGIHGYKIGASAERIPMGDGTVNKMSLQCAFEHFMGNIDTLFIREVSRVLSAGGLCLIVPLYMHNIFQNIYDPILMSNNNSMNFDEGAEVCAEVELGGFFERMYSPESLRRIVVKGIGLDYCLYKIEGHDVMLNKYFTKQNDIKRVDYALLIKKER
jgi:hypothetical protein